MPIGVYVRKPITDITRLKMRQAALGRKHSLETRQKISLKNVGREMSVAGKQSLSRHFRGRFVKELNPNWRGGVTTEVVLARRSVEYKEWRKKVFERDGYKCVMCDQSPSGRLNADHLKSFTYYPDLRFELTNGRTLCVDCHRTTDNYGLKARKSAPSILGCSEEIFSNGVDRAK